MKNLGIYQIERRSVILSLVISLAVILSMGAIGVVAQGSKDQVIDQAQSAVREQIINQEIGRDQVVAFNNDAFVETASNSAMRVRGTGSLSRNSGSQNTRVRNGDGEARVFSYEASVSGRNRAVSGIRYVWKGGWSTKTDNDGGYRGQRVYCASDDGRRHTCPINIGARGIRLVNQRSRTTCVQGRNWGVNSTGVWVDRGCSADFEVGGNRDTDNTDRGYGGRDSVGGYGDASRPNGRVSYSGPITSRHSEKALDVAAQSMQDGANIQQWSYANQANQDWDVVDLGGNEVAIISRQSGKALTAQNNRDNNGANIIQRTWNDNRQQRWRLEAVKDDYYQIVSADNGKCLDVSNQSKQDGADIQLWSCAGQPNQQWRLKR
jgi:hypothetical protein